MDEKSEKLKRIIKSQFKSIRSFSDSVGIPNTTLVTALNNGIGGMAVEKVILICDKLHIDVKTFEPVTIGFECTEREKMLIKKYRALDERGKKAVDDTANSQLESMEPSAAGEESDAKAV